MPREKTSVYLFKVMTAFLTICVPKKTYAFVFKVYRQQMVVL